MDDSIEERLRRLEARVVRLEARGETTVPRPEERFDAEVGVRPGKVEATHAAALSAEPAQVPPRTAQGPPPLPV